MGVLPLGQRPLQPPQVEKVILAAGVGNEWRPRMPFPMFDVTISEGQYAAIQVSFGGEVSAPFVFRIGRDADVAVVDGSRIFINEHKGVWR